MLTYKRLNKLRCVDLRKITFGYIFPLFVITISTMEVEFVACLEATIQVLWLQNFTLGFGIVDNIMRLLNNYCDKYAIVLFSKYNCTRKHNKRFKLCFFKTYLQIF
ncbi:hypothetical protein CR513_13349, partial [Mucuna pruriens]